MSKPTLTIEQQRAIETRGVAIALTAGAGSGKTTVLTQRYLSYLFDDGLQVRDLAAITFTEKAATEMRRRIRATLEARIHEPGGDIWKTHLADLETAFIGTIHSFCSQIVRRFAVAAGVDPAFGVMEEAVAPNVRADSLRGALYEILLEPSEAGAALCDLVRCFGWTITHDAVGDLLEEPDRGQWRDWISRPVGEWVQRWLTDARPEAVRAMLAEMASPGGKIDRLFRLLATPTIERSPAGPNARIVLDEFARLATAADPGIVVKTIVERAGVKGVVTAKHFDNPADYAVLKDGYTALRDTLNKKLFPILEIPEDVATAAEFGRKFLLVTARCDAAYAVAKRRRSELDFDDLLEKARDLLRDRPDVRRACRATYKRVLVDELQDTDPVQMEFIGLLTNTDERLFAVGDSKQSIYRFRGADVTLFNGLCERVPEAGRQQLTVNFRSQPAILDFVNALVGPAMTGYEPLKPAVPAISPDPCVEFLWTPHAGNADVNRRLAAAALAHRLRELIDRKAPIASDWPRGGKPRPRAVRPGDVVLLFRSMTSVMYYEQALEDAKLDYYVVGGTAFYSRQEVYDWLDMFRVIESPLDSLSLAGVLRSPFVGLSDDAVYRLARDPRGLHAALRDPATRESLPGGDRGPAERIATLLPQWRDQKDRVPIAELFRRVLADTGYDAALMYESLPGRKLANLWKLLDLARQFDAAGGFTLSGFVQRLAELVDIPPKEQQAATQPAEATHVIRLMSIHQAKGLEFPVVVLPEFTAKSQSTSARAAWHPKFGCVANPPKEDPPVFPPFPYELWKRCENQADAEEALRVLYVATTRAMDYLLITGALPSKEPENHADRLLCERFDRATGELKDPNWPRENRPLVTVTPANSRP
ncbi:MAG: UvrD-helicase domain-containing protein [Gemmataceae bacterium]|nr:UvrD-helicase domain-containing protein [Gemmataceae bacterium]